MEITFRYAKREDAELLLTFTHKIGVYEKADDKVSATKESIEKWMFDKQYGEALFIMVDGKEVGSCVFHEGFADYLGKGFLFIDQLYLDEEYRGSGLGKAVLKKMAEITIERDCERLEWLCLDWNPAYRFYEYMGAKPQTDLTTFRVTGQELYDMLKK